MGNNVVAFAYNSAVYGGAYFAIEQLGVLSKIPMFSDALGSANLVPRALAGGAMLTLSGEVARMVVPDGRPSNLMSMNLMGLGDDFLYSAALSAGYIGTGADLKLKEVLAGGVPAQLVGPVLIGVLTETTGIARRTITQRVELSENQYDDNLKYLLNPLTSLMGSASR